MHHTRNPRSELRFNRDILQRLQVGREYLDLVKAIIVALDQNGRIAFINKSGCELLGQAAEDILGKNWFRTFLPKEVRSEVLRVFRALMRGELRMAENFENPVVTSDGSIRHILWHNTLLRDNMRRPVGTLSAGIDITAEREMETRLREEKEKSEMYFDFLSHDIANMISPIKVYSEMIGVGDLQSPDVRQMIQRMVAQAELASKFVLNLKRIEMCARISAQETTEIDVLTLVRDIERTIKQRFRDREVKFNNYFPKEKLIAIGCADCVRHSIETLLEVIAKGSVNSRITIGIRISKERSPSEKSVLRIGLEFDGTALPAEAESLIRQAARARDRFREYLLSDVGFCILMISACEGEIKIEKIRKARSSKNVRISLELPAID